VRKPVKSKAVDKDKAAIPKKDEANETKRETTAETKSDTKAATIDAGKTATPALAPASTAKTAEPAASVSVHSGAIVNNTGVAGPAPASAAPKAPATASVAIQSGAIVGNGGNAGAATPSSIVRDHRGALPATPVPAPVTSASSNVTVRDHRAGYENPSIGQATKTGATNFVTQLKSGFVLGGKAIGHEAKVAASAAASAAKGVYHFVGGLF
jgi:hypothetical protein